MAQMTPAQTQEIANEHDFFDRACQLVAAGHPDPLGQARREAIERARAHSGEDVATRLLDSGDLGKLIRSGALQPHPGSRLAQRWTGCSV